MGNRRDKRNKRDKRKEEKRKNQLQLENAKRQRRHKLMNILKRLDLGTVFKQTTIQESLLNSRDWKITVDFAEDIQSSGRESDLRRRVKEAENDTKMEFPVWGEQSVSDYIRTVYPLVEMLANATSQDRYIANLIIQEQNRLVDLMNPSIITDAILTLGAQFEGILVEYGRIDSELYYVEVTIEPHGVRYLIGKESSQERSFTVNGEKRRAYRCGQPYNSNGIEWISWAPRDLGLSSDDSSFPVYVQSHALRRLYERAIFTENGEYWVHDGLYFSLSDPIIIRTSPTPDQFLVEYCSFGFKLGYLQVSQLEDAFLIHTFLFLTMDGTPEGKKLRKRLNLGKLDKEHLELDRIQTFLFTDLQTDKRLVELLSECDCGHLFKITKNPLPNLRQGVAKYSRTFLKLN